jgi:hypothetical protein
MSRFDLRPGSRTANPFLSFILSPEEERCVFVMAWVRH